MIWRRIPPVLSPVSTKALAAGAGAVLGLRRDSSAAVGEALRLRYGARDALLTDSGTSALVLILRKLLPAGGTVALPAYACIDLTSAAVGAGVGVRLYDIDPTTLSPDLDSVRAVISRGADAIVVAHLYGYPADFPGVQKLAAERGIPLIEDAAQGSGGTLGGRLLGSFGDSSILSFGRGKGTTSGSGGALLVNTESLADWTGKLREDLVSASRGAVPVLSLLAQRVFSHPLLYNIPASIPALKLGEMVYRQPHLPRAMTTGSAAVLELTLDLAEAEVKARRERAKDLLSAMRGARDITPVHSIAGGEPGYLRLAVVDNSGTRDARPDLGVLRGYPMTLDEHPQLQSLLHEGERAGPGSRDLRDRLFTIPTHSHAAGSYPAAVLDWLTEETLSPRFVPVVS